jgi:hypothetical protein
MPPESVDKAVDLLRERMRSAEREGLAPKITSTRLAFRYSSDVREDPWTDALLLVADIVKKPRHLVSDRYAPRALKPAGIGVTAYLEAMDVWRDGFVKSALGQGWESPGVSARAHDELGALDSVMNSDLPGQKRLEQLLALLGGGTAATDDKSGGGGGRVG